MLPENLPRDVIYIGGVSESMSQDGNFLLSITKGVSYRTPRLEGGAAVSRYRTFFVVD
jgi:hypothetical protein